MSNLIPHGWMKFNFKTFSLCLLLTLVSCSKEEDLKSEIVSSHQLEPTDEMILLAKDQCQNDLSLEQGVVELKHEESGEIVSRAVVNC